jgi:pimeloyl-ACP methyl ester carboxylesterase
MKPPPNFLPKLLALALLLLFCFPGCAKPEPVLVVTVGGLGFSQMGDLRHAIIRQCPQAKVISAGAWDAYKTDITALATAKPHQHIILVGHSFGCQAIANAASQLPKVDLAVFIDPAWNDFPLPAAVASYLWYQRSGLGLEREARILGAAKTITIEGGHNDIPHAPQLIASVISAINAIPPTKPQAEARGSPAPPPPAPTRHRNSAQAPHPDPNPHPDG